MKLVSFLSLAALSKLAVAHFLLNYPPTLGFDDDNEGISPCGGFTPALNGSAVEVQVDGFPIALTSTHPEADWLFRATLSLQEPLNWTNLLPVVHEVGLGDFCIPDFKVPAEFAGKSGLLQILENAVDGELYQCAAVRFVAGTNSSVGSGCHNVTGLTATITDQNTFTNASNSSPTATTGTASATGASASETSSSLATPQLQNQFAVRAAAGMALAALALTGGVIFVI